MGARKRTGAQPVIRQPAGMASKLAARLRDLWRDRRGATAVEYGLIAGGISVAIIVVIFTIGGEVNDLMVRIRDMLASKN